MTARVTRIEPAAKDTLRFFFEIPGLERFDFIPGQFVTLDLPIHEKPAKRTRSYSIASWPDGTNRFELLIVLNPQGLGTNHMWKAFHVGTEVPVRGPLGVFTLPERTDRQELFLICTGTGIAPFRSMVHHALTHGSPYAKVHLVFGTRTRDNLFYFEEFKALAAAHPAFDYIPVLSRETWAGETGYVHPVYERLASAHPAADFYLCGWRDMIDEAVRRITAMGYDRKSIHREIFG
jgi:CDP-4-dehydro-6-deoxyglucose reductase